MATKTFIAVGPTNYRGLLVPLGKEVAVPVVKGKTTLDDHKCWREAPPKPVVKTDKEKAADKVKEAADAKVAEEEANIKAGLNPDGSGKVKSNSLV
jgi:hypothetical protein